MPPSKRTMTSSSLSSVSSSEMPENICLTDDFSLNSLQMRVQGYVSSYQSTASDDTTTKTIPHLAVAIAGGGGHFVSTLSSTSGASRLLLEGSITYHPTSYHDYLLQNHIPMVQNINDNQTTLKTSKTDSLQRAESFQYASLDAAMMLSRAAVNRALNLLAQSLDSDQEQSLQILAQTPIGIGCTSSLQSTTSTRKNRTSRAHIVVQDVKGRHVQLEASLSLTAGRTRMEEDTLVGHLLLTCLEYATSKSLQQTLTQQPTLRQQTKQGDDISISCVQTDSKKACDVLKIAAKRILKGIDDSVALVPTWQDGSLSFTSLPMTILPPNSLVIPGSFNPPHKGHVELAKAAMKATGCEIAFFELSITNADKPSLTAEEVARRLQGFLTLTTSMEMPDQWGLILSDAPLFVQKVDLFHPKQVPQTTMLPSSSVRPTPVLSNAPKPPLPFVIGTDTLVRILNPKYYNHDTQQMLQAMERMDCTFVVGGRVEQSKSTTSTDNPVFVTGDTEIQSLPSHLQSKFIILPSFRVDISSTELRKQREQEQQV